MGLGVKGSQVPGTVTYLNGQDVISTEIEFVRNTWKDFEKILIGCKVTTINMADDVERLMNVEKCDRVNFQTFF